ncbi:TIGR02281 family clan AA aspartic protease [Aestuariivita sp.]|jgi:aspartyl protease family protein|uniref:retropepsin-like aspartic protease family protein n=1 Tax=Aestuariivita sp. TaxID=1872407 RepID=UPI002172F5CC|nr:TIGR02281 family clan AA aspartic protease [Aestuariivita sp.]MCE8007813.1 TIGR02281 family clan AA aspartic protease [Aestuariivita sp.]
MSEYEIGRLIFLVMLGTALVVAFAINHRQSLNRSLQHAVVWALIFLAVIAGIGLWEDVRDQVLPRQAVFADQGRVEVPRSPDGHYYVTLDVNGAPIDFVVDTGATGVVLSQKDAEASGLPMNELVYLGRAMTANGEVRTAPVRLDTMALGPIVDRNVPAWVNEGDLDRSLLGMAYLQRWDRIEITRGELILTR